MIEEFDVFGNCLAEIASQNVCQYICHEGSIGEIFTLAYPFNGLEWFMKVKNIWMMVKDITSYRGA